MRRSTSSLDQRAVRSAATVCRAPLNVPSGFGARCQMWPLSRWVWRSTKQGQTWPPSSRTAGEPAGAVPAGPIRATAAARHLDVGEREPVAVDLDPRHRLAEERRRYAAAAQPVVAARGHVHEAHGPYRSRARALSCQRRKATCESADSARKITMPLAEIRISAANILGICIV